MTQVAAPADRRFRRAHVKPARRRRWRSIVRLSAIYGVVLAVLGAAAYRGSSVVAEAGMLRIDRLIVTGNERVPTGRVLEALDGLKGENLVWADLDQWRARLLKSPWVRDAALRRSLPSTVEIAVWERVPTILARIDSRLFLMDEQGVIIDAFGPEHQAFDLPIVDGLSAPKPGPGVQADDVRAALAARVVSALRAKPDLAKRLSQMDVSDPHNARVRLVGDQALLILGEDQFLQRLESYLQIAGTLRASVPDIDYVDLRFGERVFVGPAGKTKKTPVAVPAGRVSDDARRRGGARQR
jgi:cell division protein FtsQ